MPFSSVVSHVDLLLFALLALYPIVFYQIDQNITFVYCCTQRKTVQIPVSNFARIRDL